MFDGSDVTEADAPRLTGQLQRIYDYIKDGEWHTLQQIASTTGAPEASVSAQLRNLRKPRFGAHQITKTHVGEGLYLYRLTG